MRIPDFMGGGELWAFISSTGTANEQYLASLQVPGAVLVSSRHHFRNLSNTTDFYYQQRFNSADSGDAPTVAQYLAAVGQDTGSWTVKNVTERLHLDGLLEEQVIKLSNGETRRVLIGAALLGNPRTLLVADPFSGLDSGSRKELSDLLADISSAAVLVIVACRPSEIPPRSTHVAVITPEGIKWHGRYDDLDRRLLVSERLPVDARLLASLVPNRSPEKFEHAVRMENVTVRYDEKLVLEDVSWTVRQGERWSLSGRNGAGKSTLLSLITGDNPQAYANDIILFDRKRGSGESIWDVKRRIGFVSPELFQYFPSDTSCVHVVESGYHDTVGLFRMPDPEKTATSIRWMQLFGIEEYRHTLFSRTPAAVQRACLLARALVKNPPLLVLDEPTQGLDFARQLFFRDLIDELCRLTNVTLIYVSHFSEHIPTCVDHHLHLEHGRVIRSAKS